MPGRMRHDRGEIDLRQLQPAVDRCPALRVSSGRAADSMSARRPTLFQPMIRMWIVSEKNEAKAKIGNPTR